MKDTITAAQVQKSVAELAGHVRTLAREIYKEGYPEGMGRGSEEEQDYDDILPDKDAARDMYKDHDEDGDNGMMPYDDESEEMYMARMRKGFRTRKGFADAAEEASDEEDSKWDEKDSKIDGNEPSPAGDMAGSEDDETFGPGGMAYSAMLKNVADIGKVVQSISAKVGGEQVVLSKGLIPGGDGSDHRVPGGAGGSMVVTREMQEQAKGRSWRDINRLRMDVGDLPRNIF